MVEPDNRQPLTRIEDIGRDFFSDYETALLCGLGLDIAETNLGAMAQQVGKNVVYLRKGIFSIKNRLLRLEGSHNRDFLRFSFLKAFDEGLVDVPKLPIEPNGALTVEEKKIMAFLSLGYSNNYIGQTQSIHWRQVDNNIKDICEKFGTSTIYPVIAQGRLEMRGALLQQQGGS